MLKISALKKEFETGTPDRHTVFDDFSLTLEEGDFVTIIGSNGSGKSTLFNLISGASLPDSGNIALGGESITFLPEYRRAKLIGRIFQDPKAGTAPEMTVEENLAIAWMRGTGKRMLRRISRGDKEYLRQKVAELGMGLENRMQTRIGLLSGGQRQAITLVMATLVPPKLLLLDEHTAALDPLSAGKVMELTNRIVSRHKLTTMMITHNIESALKTGNRTILLDNGVLALDFRDPERREMSVQDVLRTFEKVRNKTFDNDRILL